MKALHLTLPLLLTTLVACSSEVPPYGDAAAAQPGGAAREMVTRAADAAGAEAEVVPAQADGVTVLRPGQVLEIALEGNPSTGFSWEVVADGLPQLIMVPTPESPPAGQAADPAEPERVGAPRMQHWHLRAAEPGEATVSLVYRRAWEPGTAPAREVAYRVRVEAAQP